VANFKVVVLDETSNWSDKMVKKAGGKIFASYLYDSAQAVNLCELTPSYNLCHLFSTPLVDDEQHSVQDLIGEEDSHCANNDKYIHCCSIDALPPERFVYDFGFELVEDKENIGDSRYSLEEDHREYCQANCGGLQFPLSKIEPDNLNAVDFTELAQHVPDGKSVKSNAAKPV
jgi:hypothetical protein